ncbi:MAG: UDP-N-acetylmuramate--L-alanine ligase [Acidimicrobiia bacterium]
MSQPEPAVGQRLDLTAPRRLHIVGAGGAGMSAYTAILAEMGHIVSGSDVRENSRLDRLRLLGVDCSVPQRAANLRTDLDAVIISSAVPLTNVEVQAAVERGIPVLSRADALASIVATRRGIGVAGTHGKTTTSSMITLIMRAAGMHPSFLIGSELNEVGANAGLDRGDWLVVEADESDGTFLELPLEAALVTNVDNDHLWFWGSMDALRDGFATFIASIERLPVVCADDEFLAALAAQRTDVVTYGLADGARYRALDYRGGPHGSHFVLEVDGESRGEIQLPIIGRHHAQNAAGAAAITMELGCDFESVRQALAGFGGVARRFQHRGTFDGVDIIDDYALLPPEVHGTIGAAREAGYRRVIAVFQPFRYARTAVMWAEFADAFVGADQVVLTDVCGFHEPPIPGITGELLVRAVLDAHPDQRVAYFPHRAELADLVPGYARPGDVILTLGGGDITSLGDELLGRAERRR